MRERKRGALYVDVADRAGDDAECAGHADHAADLVQSKIVVFMQLQSRHTRGSAPQSTPAEARRKACQRKRAAKHASVRDVQSNNFRNTFELAAA